MPGNHHQQPREKKSRSANPDPSQKSSEITTLDLRGQRTGGGLSQASPQPEPQQHDTLGTPRFDAWDGAFRPGVRRPILARLRRALAACMDARAVGLGVDGFRGQADAFGALDGQSVQRKCATRITSRSSGCCRRRTLPAFAGCRGARSTERLRGASCGRHGSATGSASIRPSWRLGSREKRAGRVRRPGAFGGASAARRVACAPCSMKARKARRGR
jgi:hypothetical protein